MPAIVGQPRGSLSCSREDVGDQSNVFGVNHRTANDDEEKAMASATYQPWPELPYEEFAPTAYLMHMITQVVGKLKLATPFEPQWANVPLWVTSRGLTTGPIPNGAGTFIDRR